MHERSSPTHMFLSLIEDVGWWITQLGLHGLLDPVINVDTVRSSGREVLLVQILHYLLELVGEEVKGQVEREEETENGTIIRMAFM